MTAHPAPDVITSAANPAIALVRSLDRRDRRAAERAFVVEGVRAVRDALQSGASPRLILARQDATAVLDDLLLPAETSVRLVASRVFDRLSQVQTSQGLRRSSPSPRSSRTWKTTPLLLVLDRLRDPGNLGTLLRAAAGAGVNAVYLSPESVDPWNPKAARAGMGAHFRVPLLPLDDVAMTELAARLPNRVVASTHAATTYDAIDWTMPSALVIGGEASGVGTELAAWGTEAAAIPLAPGVESLNAAVAGAVILFEAARQRRAAHRERRS